jgi:hypothetical protein
VLAPYDFFAIEWGYKPIASAKTAEEEKKALDEFASEQIKNPFLRFGGEDDASDVDPTVLRENIGSDPIQATACGLKNLDRVMDHLIAATTEKGEDFTLLEEVYAELVDHRAQWFEAVAKQVGGVVEYRTLGGRGGETFVRVPKDKQREAVKFLLDNALSTPTKLLNPGIVNQFKFAGTASAVTTQQRKLLSSLLSPGRMSRLFDGEILLGDKAYTPIELVDDLQAGLFSELKSDSPKFDPVRRALQRVFVDILKNEIVSTQTPSASSQLPRNQFPALSELLAPRANELRAVARVALGKLDKELGAAKGKTKDSATVAHILDLQSEIKSIP